jgi:tetratricopeptide (TPR) repeat protein
MPINQHRPAFHSEVVRQALEAMRTGRKLAQTHPLRFSLSVQQRIEAPYALSGDAAVQFAVFSLLTEKVRERLAYYRAICQIVQPPSPCHLATLRQDYQQGNSTLEAWSTLHYRYICIEHALSQQDIAVYVNQDQRTIRRRQDVGLERLTQELIEDEQELRRQQRQQRLQLLLPSRHPAAHFRDQTFLETLRHIVCEGEAPQHLVLDGPAGIGKSSIALWLAHKLVEAEILDDLLWLDVGDAPLSLTSAIASQLDLPQSASPETALLAYLYSHTTLLVLDNADHLLAAPEEAERILSRLDSAIVILTSRRKPPANTWVYQVTLPELSREQAFDFLMYVSKRTSSRKSEDAALKHFDTIWQTVGGNPSALRTVLSVAAALPLQVALERSGLESLYSDVWQRLSTSQCRMWLLTLLFPDGIHWQQAQSVTGISAEETVDILSSLVDESLLMVRGEDRYELLSVAATFLSLQVQHGAVLPDQQSADTFLRGALDVLVTLLVDQPQPEHALRTLKTARHLELDIGEYYYRLAPQITEAGLWHEWASRVQSFADAGEHNAREEMWLNQALGTALRWTGHLEEARTYLEQALNDYQRVDDVQRGNVLTELAVLDRYQGNWRRARRYLEEALVIYTHLETSTGIMRCLHGLAQLALEANDPERALLWLSRGEDHWTGRTWGIASQAHLLLGDLDTARQAAEKAAESLPAHHPNQGRLLATLGQIYDAMGKQDTAVGHLIIAAELLDQTKDMLGYARASNNLAIAYLNQSSDERAVSLDEIEDRLLHVAGLQEYVGDEVGLAVTRNNLEWIASLRDAPG